MSTQNENRTYNVLPGPSMGLVTPDYLEKLLKSLKKYDIPFLKMTTAQRFAIAGHSEDTARAIWRDLGFEKGPQKPVGIHYVQACPGARWCKYGRQDSLELGEKIKEAFGGLPLPAKTKIGISGCAMNCCECYIRDIGIFGMKKGWTVVFGGNGGGCPRIGDIVAEGIHAEQVLEVIGKCLDFYQKHARKFERTGRFMRRTDIEKLRLALQ